MSPFQAWWSSLPSRIDPYLVEVGSFRVGYYGLMYVAGFATVYLLALHRSRKEDYGYRKDLLQEYIYWGAVGLIIGARLGYVFFYNLGYYVSNPLEILLPFRFDGGLHYTGISGMSYHGGVIGLIAATVLFARRSRLDFWRFGDFMVPAFPLGYTFGRIGNFINGELYGRATTVPWGMYFPLDPEGKLRHPSQLYEAFAEGALLFALLWKFRKRRPFAGFHIVLYLVGYGSARFVIEFFREPDSQLGFVLGGFSMGQVLCALMVTAGVGIIIFKSSGSVMKG